jgi:hypothetical protein
MPKVPLSALIITTTLILCLSACSSTPLPSDYWPLDGVWLVKVLRCKKGTLSEQGKNANKALAHGEYRAMIRYEHNSEQFMINMYKDAFDNKDRCEGRIDSEIRYPRAGVLEVLRSDSKFQAHGNFAQQDCLGDNYTVSYKRQHHFEIKGSRLILKLSDSQPIPQLAFDFCTSGQPVMELDRAL